MQQYNARKLSSVLYFLVGVILLAPTAVFAQSHILNAGGTGDTIEEISGLGSNSIGDISESILGTIVMFLGLVMIVLIIYAGVLWMTAQGESDKIDKAKKVMSQSAIGLLLVISSMSIVSFISTALSGATGSRSLVMFFSANDVGLANASAEAIVARVAEGILGILSLVAVVLVIYGGVLWMTAGGEEDKVDRAKKIIRNAFIGLLLLVSAVGITNYITRLIVEKAIVETVAGEEVPDSE